MVNNSVDFETAADWGYIWRSNEAIGQLFPGFDIVTDLTTFD
jgi:hypothetical protein